MPHVNNKSVSSYELHNENCFNYLKNLSLPTIVSNELPKDMVTRLNSLKDAEYISKEPYADLYTQFFAYTEENIEQIYDKNREKLELDQTRLESLNQVQNPELFLKQQITKLEAGKPSEKLKQLDNFILSIYNNNNKILPNTFYKIKHLTQAQTPSSPSLEKSIAKHVSDKGTRINKQSPSPAQTGSLLGRAWANISRNFKPQHTTSLATVRNYKWNENSPIREYRFGTQGQRHKGKERVSPLFERFIQALARKPGNEGKINHIYFNNLGRDRKDSEGKREKRLTDELEKLETQYKNLAVITLPADRGLMDKNDYKKTMDKCADVYEEFVQIATEDSKAKRETKDFHISEAIREKVFDNNGKYTKEIEKEEIKKLLDKSFNDMGIDKNGDISSAQRQAVWTHFNKYELTNHIITKLNPESINFSCKDAIDRGGVSSAYYNLMKSFEKDSIPMDRNEFEQALHAAPTMVKARGMNHHLKVIWNAVDAYINAKDNSDKLSNDENKKWLIDWRDANRPQARIKESQNNLNNQQKVADVEEKGLSEKTQNQSAHAVNSKRSLLDRVKDFVTKLMLSKGTPEKNLPQKTDSKIAIQEEKQVADQNENKKEPAKLKQVESVKLEAEEKSEQSNTANINSDSSFKTNLEMTSPRGSLPSTSASVHDNFDKTTREQSNTADCSNLLLNSDSSFESSLEMTPLNNTLRSTLSNPLNKVTDMQLYVIAGKNDKTDQAEQNQKMTENSYGLTRF